MVMSVGCYGYQCVLLWLSVSCY